MSEAEEESNEWLLGEENDGDEFDPDDPAESATSDEPPRKRLKPVVKDGNGINCHFSSCKRSYKTLQGYRKHLGQHVVEDLLTNAPGLGAVLQECRSKYLDVLQEMQQLSQVGGITGEICTISAKMQSVPTDTAEIFIDCVGEELYACLPAPSETDVEEIHPTIMRKAHILVLADVKKRNDLLNLLKDVFQLSTYSDQTLQWFLTEFVKLLISKVEFFYSCCLSEPHKHLLGRSEINRDDPDNVNFQQCVHYIGGSAVKSVLRKAQKGLGTEHWSEIYDCMNSKFLVKEGLPSPGEEIEAWTDGVDRGGLKHINAKVWSFLMALSAILKKEEGADGSIFHENIFKIITNDDVMMFLWNDITENSLLEEVDLLLLRNFCEFFTNTWLRGVVLRRKNAVYGISCDVTALRSKLA